MISQIESLENVNINNNNNLSIFMPLKSVEKTQRLYLFYNVLDYIN